MTFEEALKELQEICPFSSREIQICDACQRLDVTILIDGVQRGTSYNSINALSEAMDQVREWKPAAAKTV